MDSFLQIGSGVDEAGYFKTIIEQARSKTDAISYAERRAQEMAEGDMGDFALEGKPGFFFINFLGKANP